MSHVRIVLCDDHALVRAGLRALIEEVPGWKVVAEASDGRAAVVEVQKHQPDVVVMDISMVGLNGIEALSRIRVETPSARVLMLSMHSSEEFVRRALKAGASGYMVKDSAPLELHLAIEALMRGEVYLSPRISRHAVSHLTGGASPGTEVSLDALTSRQREILQLIAEGRSTKQIAFGLEVSVKTVESHRAALMDRLAIHDLAGLVIYAVRNHLVSLD